MTRLEYHEVAALFPMMTREELAGLEADIRKVGQLEPIWLHDGRIVDGRNRYEACVALGLEPFTCEWDGRGSLVEFVLSKNLHRRHLTSGQKAALAVDVLPMLEAEARDRRGTRTDLVQTIAPSNFGKSREHAAMLTGTNHAYVSDAKALAEEAPDLFQAVRAGKKTIPQAKKEHRKAEKERRKTEVPADLPERAERHHLHLLPVARLHEAVAAGSVDWVITDPPYPAEFLPVYSELAEFAAHALKPGGGLLCMIGQSYLPEILARLTPHLAYHWTVAYLTPGGQSAQLWERKVNTFWKPVLWFVKGARDGDWIGDVTRSDVNDNDKDHHHWGQSESGMVDLFQRFTYPGQLVCDPFLGGGTTAVVASALNRRFIGADVDPDAITATARRLAS